MRGPKRSVFYDLPAFSCLALPGVLYYVGQAWLAARGLCPRAHSAIMAKILVIACGRVCVRWFWLSGCLDLRFRQPHVSKC